MSNGQMKVKKPREKVDKQIAEYLCHEKLTENEKLTYLEQADSIVNLLYSFSTKKEMAASVANGENYYTNLGMIKQKAVYNVAIVHGFKGYGLLDFVRMLSEYAEKNADRGKNRGLCSRWIGTWWK